MGDTSIADALKEGVGQAVGLLGETLMFSRAEGRQIDPSNPSRYIVTRWQNISVEGTVSDIEDSDIDGVIIKVGDKVATVVAGARWPIVRSQSDGSESGGGEFVPAVGDNVTSGGIEYRVESVKTNRIAGVNVSYEVLLR